MDQQYPTVAKIPVLDTEKFEQWQFRMQQYLQHEHYALWEVIEFRDSYEVPANDPSTTTTNTTSGEAGTKSGRTAAILKTFGGNEATKKTKKNLLKQQYGNFRAEGSETLEQTFTRLQVIVGKKISIQRSDVAGFDKLKVKCFNCHKMGHFARECRAPRNQDRGRRDNYRQGSKAEEQAPKALMAIDGVGWDWSYMANDEEDHALVTDEEAPTKFSLMANTSTESKVFDNSLCSKDCKKNNDSLNTRPEPNIPLRANLGVLQLGYPKLVRNLSSVVTNDMFQPWKELTTIINLCFTGKTSGFERPWAPVL
nr:hypothetical protein [Tanacetum cinerariifolium]